MYAEDTPVVPVRREPRVAKGFREQQVMDLFAKQPVIGCKDLVANMGVSCDHAAVILNKLYRARVVARTGTRTKYRYTLAEAAP